MASTVTAKGLEFDPAALPSLWPYMTKLQRASCLIDYPIAGAILDSLIFLREWTKTEDEKDLQNPYKPFPEWPYFDFVHELYRAEDTVFLKKSRTMMATWWGVGECFHYVMTHQPAGCIFWCPDEDRAVKCIEYCRTLYKQMRPELQTVYPPAKDVDLQAVFTFQFRSGGYLMALPGKNPDKIRSEHPAVVMMDEVGFNEHAAEAYANAVSTKPKKLLGVSSANAGWFFEFIERAEPEPIDPPLTGVTLSRMPQGKPGAGIPVVRLHYTADPNMTPDVVAALKVKYPDESLWNKEMEIDPKARGGQRVFPRFNRSANVTPRSKWRELVPLKSELFTVYHVCDPHPRTPDAHLWLAVGKDGSKQVVFSWFPDEKYEIPECAKMVKEFESVGLWPKPLRRAMDQAGQNWNADEHNNWFDGYQRAGLTFQPAKKNLQYHGYRLINQAFMLQPVASDKARQAPGLTIWDGCGDNAKLIEALEDARWREYRGAVTDKDPPEEPEGKNMHLPDCLSYALLEEPRFRDVRKRQSTFVVLNEGTGY